MVLAVRNLTLACYLGGNASHGKAALRFVDAWFLDPVTSMVRLRCDALKQGHIGIDRTCQASRLFLLLPTRSVAQRLRRTPRWGSSMRSLCPDWRRAAQGSPPTWADPLELLTQR